MKNELPKVYANTINKKFNNTQELFSSLEKNRTLEKKLSFNELIKKINQIFNSPNHVYKSEVVLNIKGDEVNKVIVGKNSNNLLTLDGEMINLNDIWDIKKRS